VIESGAQAWCPRPGTTVRWSASTISASRVTWIRPLTTILAQPMRQIGEGTVRLLLGILADGGDAEKRLNRLTLPHKLVVRREHGAAADDPSKKR